MLIDLLGIFVLVMLYSIPTIPLIKKGHSLRSGKTARIRQRVALDQWYHDYSDDRAAMPTGPTETELHNDNIKGARLQLFSLVWPIYFVIRASQIGWHAVSWVLQNMWRPFQKLGLTVKDATQQKELG